MGKEAPLIAESRTVTVFAAMFATVVFFEIHWTFVL
jgi:hypothetical protein